MRQQEEIKQKKITDTQETKHLGSTSSSLVTSVATPIMLSCDDAVQGIVQFLIHTANVNKGNIVTFSPVSVLKKYFGKDYFCVRNLSLINYVLKAMSEAGLIYLSHIKEKRVYYKMYRRNSEKSEELWSIAVQRNEEELRRLIENAVEKFDEVHTKKWG